MQDAPRGREVPADAAWLEGRKDAVHDVVHALAGTAAEGILDRLDKAVFERDGRGGAARQDPRAR